MIIDQSPLAGSSASLGYWRGDGSFITNLADDGQARTGTSPPLKAGMGLQVSGIDLSLSGAGAGLDALFEPQAPALLRIDVRKEMFPKLYADPYAHRVHAIGGFEDFRRGKLDGLEVMEIDGVATLVSVAESCTWVSRRYVLPELISIGKAAWSIPASLLSSADAFRYRLELGVWPYDGLDGAPLTIVLSDAGNPTMPRRAGKVVLPDGSEARKIQAYQIVFSAQVRHDAAISERYSAAPSARSLGRPLLDGINILEQTDTVFEIGSLAELLALAVRKDLIYRDGLLTQIVCRLPVPALLENDESISITVQPGRFSRVEARLAANRLLRPPMIDKP